MGRKCLTCLHPERAQIDMALLCGRPVAEIARRFGLGRKSVEHHLRTHLPAHLQPDRQREAQALLAAHRAVMGRVLGELAAGRSLDLSLLRRFIRLGWRLLVLVSFDEAVQNREVRDLLGLPLSPPVPQDLPDLEKVLALLDRELNACSKP